jgi:RND family efflux transporter MFP subunit
VTLTTDAAKTAGIQIEEVRLRTFYPSVKVSGTVALNQKKYVRVTPRVAGRVEKVFAFEGDRVRAGQDLYWLYSPDLLAAQSDYLQILSRAPEAGKNPASEDEKLHESLLQSTEARLRLMGFEDADLASLRSNRRALPVVAIRAPFAGTVLEAAATAGSAVELGAPLCAIADLTSLWVHVHIFEKDLSAVAPGARAQLTVAGYPGQTFEGTLTMVGSIMDEATRTVTGRVEAANPAGKLKPGMFAEVRIISREPVSVLAVPEQAVRTIAGKTVVFVPAPGGTYIRRDVETGRTLDGYVEILKGLKEGERVTTGGSFDIKAEMLKGTLEGEK